MRCPTGSEISFVERRLQTPGISERRQVNYRIWLFIVQWESGNGDKFGKAGEKFFGIDSEGPARKQKAYRSYRTVEKELATVGKELADRTSALQKREPLGLTYLEDSYGPARPGLGYLL